MVSIFLTNKSLLLKQVSAKLLYLRMSILVPQIPADKSLKLGLYILLNRQQLPTNFA